LKRLCLLIAVLAPAVATGEEAVDLAWKTRVIAEPHRLRQDSVFAPGLALTSFGQDRGRLEGEARGRAGPVQLLLTATVFGQEGQRPDTELLANEAYANWKSGAHHFTAGKKVLSGDVGYGFRPIDVLQREARLEVLPPALEGVPHLAWERFSADDAWAVILANPGHGRRGEPKEDGSLALRYYARRGGTDLHAIARTSKRFGIEAGAAFSAVPHESLELHGSFLAQRRGERVVPLAEPASDASLLDPEQALRTVTVDSPRKALAGFTWTAESGWSLLAEAWCDGSAPTAEDWRTLADQARRRGELAGVPGVPVQALAGSLAEATRMFQQPSLSRRSLFGRLAWTDPAASGWSGALEVLRTMEDRGYTVTASLGYEADRLRVDAGVRRFGGRPDSAYRLLPERGVAFIGASLAF
jgi:hypothetical protein